jgi:DNA ligase-1
MNNDFENLQKFVDDMKSTPSSNKKKEILKKYICNEFIMKVLLYTNDEDKTYGITSDKVKKFDKSPVGVSTGSLFILLDDLCSRKLTGHDALRSVKTFIFNNQTHRDLIYNIIDKDLETRANASIINKVVPGFIPEFKVALANKYEEKLVDYKDEWYGSRKLDGVRCICKIDEYGEIKFLSRTGKLFTTLSVLKLNLYQLGLKNIVFDGEVCIVDKDNKEDFQGVMKEIKKKNHNIRNPKFFIFDALITEEFNSKSSSVIFSERLKRIPICNTTEKLSQTIVSSKEELKELEVEAKEKGYEGVMLRKNVGYKGKRSNDLLKVKSFIDAEYEVKGVINDEIRFFENGKDVGRMTLSAVEISHKGNTVKVGSGFTKEQREYYYKNPNEIIGKVIKVRYFEETVNEKGGISLRFPVFVHNYGNKRTE